MTKVLYSRLPHELVVMRAFCGDRCWSIAVASSLSRRGHDTVLCPASGWDGRLSCATFLSNDPPRTHLADSPPAYALFPVRPVVVVAL